MFRTRASSTVIAVGLAIALAAPAGADDLTSRRDRARRDREAVTARLNLARASDTQVEAEAARLNKAVIAQSARLEAAQQAQWSADAQVRMTSRQIDVALERANRLRSALEGRAVYAYVHPASSMFERIARSGSLAEASRRVALLDHVQASSAAALDDYRAVRLDLAEARESHQAAKTRATERARAETAARDRLVQAQRTTAAAQAELSRRIAQLKGEAEALAATESSIQAILASRAAANAAALARARPPATPRRGTANPNPVAGVVPSASGFSWPVRGPVTSEYGQRWGGFHSGVDIGAGSGTPIRAAKDGVVSHAGWLDGGYGNMVLVDHGGGYSTGYAHQSSVSASAGQVVKRGQTIGYVGCTGNCTGDHLHFEVRVNGAAQNPRSHIGGSP